MLFFFDLHKTELKRSLSSEDFDHYLKLMFLDIDFLNYS